MNILQKSLIGLATVSLVSVSAQAAMTYGSYSSQPYVGVKVGQFNLDRDGANIDEPTAYGVYGGFYFDSRFGMEAEYVSSDDADISIAGNVVGEMDVKKYGIYGTYHYPFSNTALYAKGKVGLAKTEAKSNFINGTSESNSENGIAGGIGLGYVITPNFNVEVEYDIMESDVDAKLFTLGAHLKF